MRYLLSLISLLLIGTFAFQFSSVSAVATGTVSGETRITIVKKKPVLSPRAELLTLKRSLSELKRKIALLKTQITQLEKQIVAKDKKGINTTSLKKRLAALVLSYEQAQQKAADLQKKIDALSSTSPRSR
jgi:predicted RNase H-like nuclease (RuvC/YqgF family)